MSIPDEQTRVFHLQWRAYSLLPTIIKDAFMFLLGVGCDGKTTDQLLQLLALAEHAIRIDGNLITRVTGGRKRGGAAPDVVDMHGRLFAYTSEVEGSMWWGEHCWEVGST
jgi:hypothetical protein